ncbi:hypothetical protein DM292_07115 [Stutzerimonas frequens]|nr:hypothetical protein DM292_07115 [Stutzerimonas frequens]
MTNINVYAYRSFSLKDYWAYSQIFIDISPLEKQSKIASSLSLAILDLQLKLFDVKLSAQV